MKQYNTIKKKYPDALLLFRVGDFYETFGEDAVKTSKVLGIILTKRGNGSASETHLAGFPHHSLNNYLPKLVKAGNRVAICDQLEDPKLTKKIVKRGVTEVVTPGVVLSDEVLQHKKNNFLAAIHFGKKQVGIAFLDISTGEFFVSQTEKTLVSQFLEKFQPNEILVAKPQKEKIKDILNAQHHTFFMEDWVFQYDYAFEKLTEYFNTHNLEGFGIGELSEGIVGCGVIMHYLTETQYKKLEHVSPPQRIIPDNYVWMDAFTVRNLELFYSQNEKGVSLIDVIDSTTTAMGGRMLRKWLAFPLVNKQKIEKRHAVIDSFLKEENTYNSIRDCLKNIADLERMLSKLTTEKINPKELLQLKISLEKANEIKQNLDESNDTILKELASKIATCVDTIQRIGKTIKPEPVIMISKGDVIAEGVSEELDALRSLLKNNKEHLDLMLEKETERTQIPSLKISFNNVFGYYIEVRNTHKEKVPEDWIRKQTLVSSERYITSELKEYEQKILTAEEEIKQIEQNIYSQLLTDLKKDITSIKENAGCVAQIDCLSSFASLAQKNNYSRPNFVTDTNQINIVQGRHPVIEHQMPVGESYIANDLFLDNKTQQIVMITGPNMSGKSAILRQTALIVLLAQIGSFVPAQELTLSIVDKIFTRVGATDNISMGESTFMVEMNETASILNNITSNSLILLDEIGRGTSTYDGISIAWAIAEYIHQHKTKAKTLFATHYHELNAMATLFDRVKNYNVSVREANNTIVFLRKLVKGGSAHSFGIHVAKMAGMPESVINVAQSKLETLEDKRTVAKNTKKLKVENKNTMQLNIFENLPSIPNEIKEEIEKIDIETLTPVEALMKLNELKGKVEKK